MCVYIYQIYSRQHTHAPAPAHTHHNSHNHFSKSLKSIRELVSLPTLLNTVASNRSVATESIQPQQPNSFQHFILAQISLTLPTSSIKYLYFCTSKTSTFVQVKLICLSMCSKTIRMEYENPVDGRCLRMTYENPARR